MAIHNENVYIGSVVPLIWYAIMGTRVIVFLFITRGVATHLKSITDSKVDCGQHCVNTPTCMHYTETHPNVVPSGCVLHLADDEGNKPLLGMNIWGAP